MSFPYRYTIVAFAVALPLTACGTDRDVTVATGDSAPTTSSGVVSPPAIVESSAATPAVTVSASYEDGEAAFRAGRYGDASAIFAAYVERRPQNVWGHYMQGLSEWKAGAPERALASFDRALSIEAGHMKTLLNSTRVLLELDRDDEALERIETAIATDSGSAEAWRLLGRVRDELGEPEAAIEAYRRAITLDPRDVWAMNNLGQLYIQIGRYEDALPPLARAVELRSNAPVFQNNLGAALERTGRFTLARRAYEDALAADSGYTRAATSLERVQGLTDAPESEPVELADLAQRFKMQVKLWQEALAAEQAKAEQVETGDTVVGDTVVSDTVVDDGITSIEPIVRDTSVEEQSIE